MDRQVHIHMRDIVTCVSSFTTHAHTHKEKLWRQLDTWSWRSRHSVYAVVCFSPSPFSSSNTLKSCYQRERQCSPVPFCYRATISHQCTATTETFSTFCVLMLLVYRWHDGTTCPKLNICHCTTRSARGDFRTHYRGGYGKLREGQVRCLVPDCTVRDRPLSIVKPHLARAPGGLIPRPP